MCLNFNVYRRRGMERKKVIIELSVLTQRAMAREIEMDVDHLVLPLKNVEYGQTVIDEVNVKEVR